MRNPPTVVSVLDLNPNKFGSLEEFTVCLSKSLAERGWRSVLLFSGPVKESIRPLFDESGAIVGSIRTGEKLRCYADLISALRKYSPEVIHFHFFEIFSVIPILASLARPKLLAFTDHCRLPQLIGPVTKAECKFWDRIVLPLTRTRVLAVSDHIKRTLVDYFQLTPCRIQVLHNGVNTRRFKPLDATQAAQIREELRIPAQAPVVTSASNLRFEKGISDLLKAAKRVLERKPDAVFVIAGGGPLFESLQHEAQELGILDSVRFTGQRSDVHRLMSLADVIAVPSIWHDPAALTVIEGMATARPVVASRMGGIPEYLADGETGILVQPKSPGQLATALLRLLDSPTEAASMGRAGRERVERYFSMEQWVRDTLDFYDKALGLTPKNVATISPS